MVGSTLIRESSSDLESAPQLMTPWLTAELEVSPTPPAGGTDDEDDLDGCDVEITETVPDEDLPPAEGGVH